VIYYIYNYKIIFQGIEMPHRKSLLTVILSGLLSASLLTCPVFTPAALLESRPVNVSGETGNPAVQFAPASSRIVSTLSADTVNPDDIDFTLIAGGIRDSQKFQDVVNEAGLVALIIGIFVVGAGLLAYHYSD
jgi:hypothetical protein